MPSRRWLRVAAAFVAIASFLARGAAAQQDGDEDSSFNFSGKLTLTFLGLNARATAVSTTPEGVILVAGQTGPTRMWRVHPRNPDGSSAPGGNTAFDFVSEGAVDDLSPKAVRRDSSQRIWFAGAARVVTDYPRPAVARILSNGSLDPSFDGNGKLLVSALPSGWSLQFVSDALIYADGRTVFVGSCDDCLGVGNNGAFVLRLDAAGAPDSDFSGDGWLAFALPGSNGANLEAVTEGPNGSLLAAGYSFNPSGSGFVARVTSSGILDTGFGGGDGISDIVSTAVTQPTDLAFDPDTGKTVVAFGSGATNSGAALIGFTSAGGLDGGFGTGGVGLNLEEGTRLDAVSFQSDGKVVTAGTINANGTQTGGFFLARTLANGTLDSSFDDNGVKRVEFDMSTDAVDHAAALTLSGGKLVVVGYASEGPSGDAFAVLQLFNAQIFSDGFERVSTGAWAVP